MTSFGAGARLVVTEWGAFLTSLLGLLLESTSFRWLLIPVDLVVMFKAGGLCCFSSVFSLKNFYLRFLFVCLFIKYNIKRNKIY